MRHPEEILILHASVGGGHRAAARALARAFTALDPTRPVRLLDALDALHPEARRLYLRSFELSVGHAPGVYGGVFTLTQDVDRSPLWRAGRRLSNRLVGADLHAALAASRPAAVVCTHFLPLEVALHQRARGRLDAPVFSVVTDYVAHGFWRQPEADLTFCPPGRARLDLIRGGVPPERIRTSGIPVDPSCAGARPTGAARARLGLSPERPLVLLLAGGAGMGPLVEVLRAAARRLPAAAQLVVVCGGNAELRERATRAAAALGREVQVLGYVDPLLELLADADLVVTKPGGLTTSECLALGKPTVFFEAAPGQESWNARYAASRGAALAGSSPDEVAALAARLLADPARRERMSAAARRAGRPAAASEVAFQVLLQASRRPSALRAG